MPRIVSIEGNIGAGKTTLFDHLKARFAASGVHAVFMPEPVDLWQTVADESGETMLTKFYRDPTKYAFSFQIMAFTTRLAMLKRMMREHPDCDVIICERSLEADRNVFAKMLRGSGKIEDVEYQVYEMLYNDTAEEFPIDRIIYVDADPEVCVNRIAKRSRTGESTISVEYLRDCREYYNAWLLAEPRDFELLILNNNPDVPDTDSSRIDQLVDFIHSEEYKVEKLISANV